MAIDETLAFDADTSADVVEVTSQRAAGDLRGSLSSGDQRVSGHFSRAALREGEKQQQQQQRAQGEEAAAPTKQPIGAAAPHLTTFVGCAKRAKANAGAHPDVNNGEVAADSRRGSSRLALKNLDRRSPLSSKQHNLLLTQSQTRINHSLESINSKYSTSSANDDSTHSMHNQQQQQQQQQQQHQQQQHQEQHEQEHNKLQPRKSLRARLSTSQASGSNCFSPIEAQLASSTCDLGINLVDGWRGSFSAGSRRLSSGAQSPARQPAAFISCIAAEKQPQPPPLDVVACEKDNATTNPGNDGCSQTSKQLAAAPTSLKPPFMFAGVLASLVGSVFFSLSVLCIKLLPNQEGFSEKVKALCFRGFFVTILCGVAIIVQRSTIIIPRDELLVNCLRAVFGTFGVLGMYTAISYISMGDATALIFSSPVWTSILSYFILGEPLQWLQLIALPASLFGIVLIAHPGLIVDVEHHQQDAAPGFNESAPAVNWNATTMVVGNLSVLAAHNQTAGLGSADLHSSTTHVPTSFDFEHRWPGIVIALATSLLVSCVYIALKFRKKTPIQTTTFWFGAFMIVSSLALQCFLGPINMPLTFYEWALLFSNGVTSWLGQTFLQWAFLYEEAGVLSIVRTLDVAMTFTLSAVFLGEEILWTSIVGAAIIGLVVVSIMLNEWLRKMSCTNGKNNTSIDDEAEDDARFGLKKDKPHLALGSGGPKSTSQQHPTKQSAYIVASEA